MKKHMWYGLAILMAVFVTAPVAIATTQLTQTFPIVSVQNTTVDSIIVVSFDPTVVAMIFLVLAFIVLLILGFYERFAMVGAALVSAIIAVLSWTWTGEPYVPAIFTLLMAVCIGMAISRKASSK